MTVTEWLRTAREWLRRNVVFIVVADVTLSLGLFGVYQYQQGQINHIAVKADCYDHVFDQAVGHHPPTRDVLEAEARLCVML